MATAGTIVAPWLLSRRVRQPDLHAGPTADSDHRRRRLRRSLQRNGGKGAYRRDAGHGQAATIPHC
ncbi:hypothetical protein [uncultured Sphingomonas sp.]|uniref:hypothetical protein n=1 Tax=uncultured Sphingomonas sp. TaxID=158754 RepID=UPI002601EC07|nr:hypothetical protein [uncultured Sphingomonas sp.]